MKIPQSSTQFDDSPTLFVITGSQSAKFYYALNGNIEEITEFKTPTPEYSDREGFFLTSGHGQTFGSGSTYENKKDTTQGVFINRLNTLLKVIDNEIEIDEVILCAPGHISNTLRDQLYKPLRDRLRAEIHGNYVHIHPKDLLEKHAMAL